MPFSRKILLLVTFFSLLAYSLELLSLWQNASVLMLAALYNLLDAFGKRVVYKDLLAFFVIAKMFFAPAYFQSISPEGQDYITRAHILPLEYFEFGVPATIALLFGLLLPIRFGRSVSAIQERSTLFSGLKNNPRYKKEGYVLFFLGIFGVFASKFLGGTSLDFVFHSLGNLMMIGALYLVFYGHRTIGYIYVGISSVIGLASGMLGAFVWPLIFFGSYFFLSTKWIPSMRVKLLLFAWAVLFLSVFQHAKYEYRNIVWGNTNYQTLEQKLFLYAELIERQIKTSNTLLPEENLKSVMQRLDQGMLVSWAMDYVPDVEPFANGETIGKAFLAAFVPRFLWPGKPKAGGREKMERFTGKILGRGVSMNIGIFGEAYVNFGVSGGIVFLFFWGIALNFIFFLFSSAAVKNPAMLLWIPLFWARGIDALETDYVSSLNTLFKVGVIAFAILFFLRQLRSDQAKSTSTSQLPRAFDLK
jgi:hypothetical protein